MKAEKFKQIKANAERLEKFVKKFGVKKTSRGRLILYKVVRKDRSNGVNRVFGLVTYNKYQTVIVDEVNTNSDRHCGTGLHGGTRKNAKIFKSSYGSSLGSKSKIIKLYVWSEDIVCVPYMSLVSANKVWAKVRFRKCYVAS